MFKIDRTYFKSSSYWTRYENSECFDTRSGFARLFDKNLQFSGSNPANWRFGSDCLRRVPYEETP